MFKGLGQIANEMVGAAVQKQDGATISLSNCFAALVDKIAQSAQRESPDAPVRILPKRFESPAIVASELLDEAMGRPRLLWFAEDEDADALAGVCQSWGKALGISTPVDVMPESDELVKCVALALNLRNG